MSRLPEPGDVSAAVDALDARVAAITNGGTIVHCGPIRVGRDGLSGEGMDPLLRAYGDLFDPGEMLSEAGFLLVAATLAEMVGGIDVRSSLSTLFLQAAALGCLMERARWEPRP